jgi:hypothetical protein
VSGCIDRYDFRSFKWCDGLLSGRLSSEQSGDVGMGHGVVEVGLLAEVGINVHVHIKI